MTVPRPLSIWTAAVERSARAVPSGRENGSFSTRERLFLHKSQTYLLPSVRKWPNDRFVYRSDSYVRADATTRTGIVITDKEDGTYTMQFSDNNYYIWTSSSDMQTQTRIDADVYFRIAEVENGYTIQRNRNYDETNFVANNSSYYVYANQTNGNIV